MVMQTVPMPRLLALVLALSLTAAACGDSDGSETGAGGPDSSDASSGAPSFGSVTTLFDASVPSSDGPATGSGSGERPAGATTASGSNQGDPDAAEAYPDGVPKPGRYEYVPSTGEDAELLVGNHDDDSAGVHQAQVWIIGEELRQLDLEWLDGRMTLRREQRARSDGVVGPMCTWEPEILELDQTLAPGGTWSYESRCRQEDENDAFVTRRSGSIEVKGLETVEVDGRPVEVMVIQRVQTNVFSVSGAEIREVLDVTEQWGLRSGLLIRRDGFLRNEINGAPEPPKRVLMAIRTHPDEPKPFE